MATAYLTGSNEELFLNVLVLLRSFERHEPGARLFVCDFGLTPAQTSYLRGRGVLLPRPAVLPEVSHPWYLKASLADFVTDPQVDTLVWIDADMFLVRPISEAVEGIARELAATGRLAAACVDVAGLSLAGFVEHFGARGLEVEPMRAALAALRIDTARPYLNSGFVVSRSAEFWSGWKSITFALPQHLLFEQNAFNLLVQGTAAGALLVEAAEWNAHGPLLAGLPARLEESSVRIVHATSDGSAHGYVDLRQPTPRGELRGRFKVLRRDMLQRVQFELLSDLAQADAALLERCGLLTA